MNIDQLISLINGGPAHVYGAVLLYFVWQAKNSIAHMESSVNDLKDSVIKLNTTITVLTADRNRDKQEIDRLGEDFSSLKSQCPKQRNQ
jgi:chromosome segregation ATPase